MPGKKVRASAYARSIHEVRCRRRSAIEAVIGHLKSEYRLGRNYLKGSVGDADNALWAGMDFNLMLLLRKVAGSFLAVMFWAFSSLIPSRKLRFAQKYTCL